MEEDGGKQAMTVQTQKQIYERQASQNLKYQSQKAA